MRNRILSITRNVIPYVKELNVISGGVLASVAMQQLDYWFHSKPDGFYKFMGPSKHESYRSGDSWTEELGMTVDEFRSAFDKIGIRYKSRTEYEKMARSGGDVFQGKFYCSYVARRENLTYYFRNHKMLDATLDALVAGSILPDRRESASNNGISKPADVLTHCSIEQIPVDGNSNLQRSGFPSTGMDIPIYGGGNPDLQELRSTSADMEIPICLNGESRGPSIQRTPTDTTTTTTSNSKLSTETVDKPNEVDLPKRGCCGEFQNSQTDLTWPTCSVEDKAAITGLLAALPSEQHQILLDELEGARAAGTIRVGLVPFAGALVRAMLAGTFTPSHSPAIATRRREQAITREQISVARSLPDMSTDAISRGQAFLSMVSGKSSAHVQQQTGETK